MNSIEFVYSSSASIVGIAIPRPPNLAGKLKIFLSSSFISLPPKRVGSSLLWMRSSSFCRWFEISGVVLVNLNIFLFIITAFIARGLRFYLLAGLLFIFGEKIKFFIDKYFNILAILFFILLIGSVLLIKFI